MIPFVGATFAFSTQPSGAVVTGDLLLAGDQQSGTDKLDLSGDEQSGSDDLKIQETL